MTWQVVEADCRAAMREMAPDSVSAIICDPPYEIGFMSKKWDSTGIAYDVAVWREALRVLKPGGHLLAFGAPRTYHRLTVAIEDAGFTIRDCLMWLYSSGFPKSRDISKALDKRAGAERPVSGPSPHAANRTADLGYRGDVPNEGYRALTKPVTPEAHEWAGWGTNLKPAWEPIVMARKPFRGSVEANVLAHGTGAINIAACGLGTEDDTSRPPALVRDTPAAMGKGYEMGGTGADFGRWPANLLLDEDAAEMIDAASGVTVSTAAMRGTHGRHDAGSPETERRKEQTNSLRGHEDSGGASRFFYVAKASTAERNRGLRGTLPKKFAATLKPGIGVREHRPEEAAAWQENDHPTVKPVDLMRYLIRLVTPPGGVVLDIFCGSGSTGVAAAREGFAFIGVDNDGGACDIARARIAQAAAQLHLPLEF